MSEAQLRVRIRKIKSRSKMASFIKMPLSVLSLGAGTGACMAVPGCGICFMPVGQNGPVCSHTSGLTHSSCWGSRYSGWPGLCYAQWTAHLPAPPTQPHPFAQELEECGLTELAAEAQAALATL